MDYDPFGAPLAPGVNLSSRAYAGLFRDGEAGLHFAQARSYQARTGRFSTVDPISGRLVDPQAWNRYAYARNNPLSFTDPTGLMPQNCSSEPATTEGGRISVTITCKSPGRSTPGSGRGGSALPGGRNGDENELEGEPDDPTDDSDTGGPESPVPPAPGPPVPLPPGPTPPGPTPPDPTPPGSDPPGPNGCSPVTQEGCRSPLLRRMASCFADHFGLTALTAASLTAAVPVPKTVLGVPIIGNSSKFTNVLSVVGLKWQIRVPFRKLGTTNVMRMAARLNVYVAPVLAIYDAYKVGTCAW